MAIANLSHAEYIPFNIVDIDIFRKVITLARKFGPDYCPPNRNMIGGELVDLNWKSYLTKTTKDMMDEADVFGLVFLGDLAMIKGRPLIKIVAYSFNVHVDVLGVKYLLKHLVHGVKKEATFIPEAFKPYLEKYDENKSCTDIVFFYGESNVQRVGQILDASYPRITVLHGSEHVVYIFSPTFKNSQLSG